MNGGKRDRACASPTGPALHSLKKNSCRSDFNVKSDLEIIPVTTVEEVLKIALSEKLQSIDWDFSEYENSDNLKSKKSGEIELPN